MSTRRCVVDLTDQQVRAGAGVAGQWSRNPSGRLTNYWRERHQTASSRRSTWNERRRRSWDHFPPITLMGRLLDPTGFSTSIQCLRRWTWACSTAKPRWRSRWDVNGLCPSEAWMTCSKSPRWLWPDWLKSIWQPPTNDAVSTSILCAIKTGRWSRQPMVLKQNTLRPQVTANSVLKETFKLYKTFMGLAEADEAGQGQTESLQIDRRIDEQRRPDLQSAGVNGLPANLDDDEFGFQQGREFDPTELERQLEDHILPGKSSRVPEPDTNQLYVCCLLRQWHVVLIRCHFMDFPPTTTATVPNFSSSSSSFANFH